MIPLCTIWLVTKRCAACHMICRWILRNISYWGAAFGNEEQSQHSLASTLTGSFRPSAGLHRSNCVDDLVSGLRWCFAAGVDPKRRVWHRSHTGTNTWARHCQSKCTDWRCGGVTSRVARCLAPANLPIRFAISTRRLR
jgi:hypothetical protein